MFEAVVPVLDLGFAHSITVKSPLDSLGGLSLSVCTLNIATKKLRVLPARKFSHMCRKGDVTIYPKYFSHTESVLVGEK